MSQCFSSTSLLEVWIGPFIIFCTVEDVLADRCARRHGSGFAPAALTTAAGNNVVFRGDSNPTDFAEITMATPMVRTVVVVEQAPGASPS